MRIKKQSKKPVTVNLDVDAIKIQTEHGSQSTDYTVLLYDAKCGIIHREDVRSLEHGLLWCAEHLLNPRKKNEVLGKCEIDEVY